MLSVVSIFGRKSKVPEAVSPNPNQVLDMFWSGMTYMPHPAMLISPAKGVMKINSMAQTLFASRDKAEVTEILRDGLDQSLHLRMMNAARGLGYTITDMPVRLRARDVDLSLNISIIPLPQFEEELGTALMLVRELDHEQVRRAHAPHSSRYLSCPLMPELLNRLPQPAWIVQAPMITTHRNSAYTKMLSRCARSFLEGTGAKDLSCSGCSASDALTLSALREATEMARSRKEVVEFPIDMRHCGTWKLVLAPCANATDGEVVCVAVPGSDLTAAASVAGTLVDLDDPVSLAGSARASEKVSAMEALQEARDLERNTIAREIHDDLGQELTVLRLSLRRLWQGVRAHVEVPPNLETEATIIHDQLDKVTSSARRIAHELRSDGVKIQGFSSAAQSLVINFQDRLGIQGQMEVNGDWVDPDHQLGWHLYRALQELLNNIAKHAYASRINVRMSLADGLYRLEVSDDGVGIPESQLNCAGVGLRSIQERAELHQGKVTIRSRPQVPGSVIEVLIPAPASRDMH